MDKLRTVFITLIIVAIAQILYYYPRIPDVVASHFDGLGDPNGWSSKAVFFSIYAAILLLTVFIFLILPQRTGKNKLWKKLPDKEYWLAPERYDATMAFIQAHFLLFGIVNMLLAMFTIQLVIQANLTEQPRLHSAIVWALLLYFGFVIVWLVRFYAKFRRRA